MKSSARVSVPFVAVLLSVALLAGSAGIAVGAPVAGVTKAQVKKLVKKGIAKEAPKLSVASAATAGDAGTVDGVDSANLVQTPGALRIVAAGAVNSDGTINTSVGQFTLAKLGTGQYRITLVGQPVTVAQFILMATPGITGEVRALVQLNSANFYTENNGVATDGFFQFVIYRTA